MPGCLSSQNLDEPSIAEVTSYKNEQLLSTSFCPHAYNILHYTQNWRDGAVYFMSENYVYCMCKIHIVKEGSLTYKKHYCKCLTM